MFKIPDHQQSLLVFGDCSHSQLGQDKLRVLVWNVWKGKRGERWKRDLLSLSEDRDLILLQEAVADSAMSTLFKDEGHGHEWHMAASFAWNHSSERTGVITGALAAPKQKRYLRGKERELFLWTPKISLGTHYHLGENRDLLVINTHVVNFTTTSSFVRFVEELVSLIGDHTGPLLLAGDFNTWNNRRWQALTTLLKAVGVQHVAFAEDRRTLKLDHVFVRGMSPLKAEIRHDVESSDHYPLMMDFQIEAG